MLFSLGLTAFGIARLYVGKRGAYVVMSLGLLGLVMARPHIAVLVMVAVFAGFIVRRGRSNDALVRSGTKIVGVLVLVAVGTIVVANASTFLGVDSFNADTLNQTLDSTAKRTDEGDSAFVVADAQSPTGFPVAAVTVLFRPFPFEAHSVTGLVASAEGMILMIVCVASWRRVRTVPRRLLREPYLLMSAVFTLVFVFAFSSFGNFGVLTRERVQVFPFLLVLLCVRARPRRGETAIDNRVGLPVTVPPGATRR
jgi:hypothetical protein